MSESGGTNWDSSPLSAGAERCEPQVRQRVRLRFRKQGELRWIGHRDLARSLERWFRRAGLRLGMSQGFHPKPRMSFPAALAVGIEGLDEVMELELAEVTTADELHQRLAPHGLPGLILTSIQLLPPGAKKAQVRSFCYQIRIPEAQRSATAERVAQLLAATSLALPRPGKAPIDVRAALEELSLEDETLSIRLRGHEGAAGPRDVLTALGLADLPQQGEYLTRTRVELQP